MPGKSIFILLRVCNNLDSPFVKVECWSSGIIGYRMRNKIPFPGNLWGSEVGDMMEVRELMCHKTKTMTMRYAHLSHEYKKSGQPVNLTDRSLQNATCHRSVTFFKSCSVAPDYVFDLIGRDERI